MAGVADLGITIGRFPGGPTASVLDVPGVGLGHATVWRDEPDPPAGRGLARTGVTVLLPVADPYRTPVPAGGAANEAVIALLAKEWRLPKSSITITAGTADRRKTVRIEGNATELAGRLEQWWARHRSDA